MADSKIIRYDFFDFRLDVEKQLLLKNGQPVPLTLKAFQILLLLVQNSEYTCKKEDIFRELWADSFVEDANLTQHIYVLRKILEKTPEGNPFIETVPRQGYRFTLPPEQISVSENPHDEAANVEGAENSFTKILPNSLNKKTKPQGNFEQEESDYKGQIDSGGREVFILQNTGQISGAEKFERRALATRTFALILFLLLGIASTGTFFYFKQTSSSEISVSNLKSIAVLPFKHIGEQADEEKLGLGMADAVITRLSNLQILEVRPTSAVFRYADHPILDALEAGRALGVESILEGSIQRDGGRVRVSVQLVRVADGKSLWAESFQENVSDIFAVQISISAKVADALTTSLTRRQKEILTRRETESADALQAYQIGVYYWNKRTKDGLWRAIEYFNQAIKDDPHYAQAHAAIADSYALLAFYRFADINEMKEKAHIAAEKALSLDDSLPEAYIALSMVYILEKDELPKAKSVVERSIALAPYNASAHHRYARILLQEGETDKAVEEIRLAQKYDPLSPALNRASCNILVGQRRYVDAINSCEKLVEISPDAPLSRVYLARAYFYSGRLDEAFNQLEVGIKSNQDTAYTQAWIAFLKAKLGHVAQAEKIYLELRKEFNKDSGLAPNLAIISFLIGRKEESLVYFKEMVKDLNLDVDWQVSLKYDPEWDDLKADPAFAPFFPK